MKSMKRTILFAVCAELVFAGVLTGCGRDSSSSGNETKVAFVYIGPVGDYGYTYAQDQGRKYLQSHLKNVKTTFVENIPETADCERTFEQLVQKGNKIIFGTSYGYMDYMADVAKRYPNVVFMHGSGYKTSKNMGTYFDRDYQARYLTGMAAGKYTKTNVLGFIAPFGTPEVVRNIDAFTLGAQSVNPNVKVNVVWTNSWDDPPTEKTAANSLIDARADVLATHVDSPSFAQAAQSKKVLAIGHNADMQKYAPKSVLVSDLSNWGPYFVNVVKSVQDHTWKSSQYWGGIKDNNVIDISSFNSKLVDKDFQNVVMQKRQDIIDGKFDPFQGPVYDQSNKLKVQQGQNLTDAQLLSIDWFVKGVQGTIPKS
ncbi:MAG TPA: BMP family ABC transporter substrate-binding protein [Ruminococcaceae bacterium]|nr:BMP family ABC transporter substrate-binding protein [Oscillospiraceae bacterium]